MVVNFFRIMSKIIQTDWKVGENNVELKFIKRTKYLKISNIMYLCAPPFPHLHAALSFAKHDSPDPPSPQPGSQHEQLGFREWWCGDGFAMIHPHPFSRFHPWWMDTITRWWLGLGVHLGELTSKGESNAGPWPLLCDALPLLNQSEK